MKICPFCNAQNKDANNYCIECGESLMLSKQDRMLNAINEKEGSLISGTPYVRSWSYKDFPEDYKKNLFKHDHAFNLSNIVYISDCSMFNNGKEGLIFKTNGFFDHIGPFARSIFIRYRDIKQLKLDSNCLYVETSVETYTFSLDIYGVALKSTLEKLIEIDKTDVSDRIEFSEEKTGPVKGESNFKRRESDYKRADRILKTLESELRRRSEQFLQDKNRFMKARDEYENLLDEYEQYIEVLENIKSEYQKLKSLGGNA